MSHRINRSALLASTMLVGVAMPHLAAAQDSDDEIIVTGSRLPQANAISASPVTTLGNVEFDIRGTTRVEDLTNTLPQVFALQGSNVANGASGTAQVALRGLGSARTLVLIDGRRMPYGSAGGLSPAADLNQIPGALVERIEVLTGGASAVYGSDAIAGVVNFIMMDDFEGIRIDGQIHGYQHGNNNESAQNILATSAAAAGPASGSDYGNPESSVFDGKGQDITLIIGTNTEDGRGNVTAYAGYRNNDAILQADRDYSKCAYGNGAFTPARPEGFSCVGSGTNPNGQFTDFSTYAYTLDENNPGQFRSMTAADTYNFAPTNFYQRPDERYTLGAFGRYEVNENLEVYGQFMFNDYRSDAQIAYTGTFFATTQINCDNPLLSTTGAGVSGSGLGQAGDLGCSALDIAAGNDTNFSYIGKRFVEGNPRNNAIRNTAYRMVGGLRGDLFEGWAYDAYFMYANVHSSQMYENDANILNMQNALFAVDDGMGGVVCRDPAAVSQGCVPLNVFAIGGVTQNQLNYVLTPSFQDGNTEQYVAEGVITADLGVYGVRFPWSEEGVGLAGGVQWRKDALNYQPDTLFLTGNLAGQGGPTPAVSGVIENTDLYVEAQIPIVTGMAFAERFAFLGGYRHSNVSTGATYSTWKLQGDWQVIPEVRVRGGWQRAARAPNVIEAFFPQAAGLTGLSAGPNGLGDPCAGNGGTVTPDASLAACLNTGVTMAQYTTGAIFNNPAQQFNGVFGGNPNLDPEVSDTYTAGIVLTPNEYVPGNMLLSVDYFDIFVDDFIGIVSAQTLLNQCLATGAANFCSQIVRNPVNGSLWTGTTTGFLLTNINTGSLATSGIDANLNWGWDWDEMGLGGAGGMELDFVGTYVLDAVTEPFDGATTFDCNGLYGGRCGTPTPTWRHRLRMTWQTPLEGFDATVSWRYSSSVNQDGVATPDPSVNRNHELASRNYIDLAASYDVSEKINVRLGVNNLLDKDPPLTAVGAPPFGNGNTYPQVYDAQGRFLFFGTTIDF